MQHPHQTSAFLLKASNFLPTNAQYTSIRSHLISKYRELVKRPLGDVSRCITCGTDFKITLPNHRIEPVLRANRFQRRHLRDEQCKTTKYQALRMKQFHTKIHNQQKLVTVCKMCKQTHTTKLTKPPNILTTKVIKLSNKNVKKRLKRLRRKKNRAFAGLNENVVLSVVNNLINTSAPSDAMCSSDPAAASVSDSVVNNVDQSPIIISDSPCTKLLSESVIELSGNETDKSVILLSSPNSKQHGSDIFFIDTTPSTSSAKPKKINKLTLANSVKSVNTKITPITPNVARNTNTNSKQVQQNKSPKLSKKQKKLLKQNNTSVSSTFVTEIASTSKQSVVKKKPNNNRILAQPLKKDKKSQKLNSLSNLLNNNNIETRTKSTSMLTEFLKTIT